MRRARRECVRTRAPSPLDASSVLSRSVRSHALASVGAAVAACALVAGCVETTRTSDGRPPVPEPVKPLVTPAEAPINAVVLITGQPIDTNGNLWRDRIDATVYLFAEPHRMPAFREGTLEFAVYPMGGAGSPSRPGKAIRTWTFSAEELLAKRSMTGFGPCYQVSLSLLADGASDRLPVDAVDLSVSFRAPDSAPVWTEGVTTIQLGQASSSSRPMRSASAAPSR